MSSIIKVNTFQDANGNALFSSDGSGNVTLSSGGMKATPSFKAQLSSNQTINHNTYTKINFDTEVYDTDNCYDNTTNYRFTPAIAGKYYCYGCITYEAGLNQGEDMYFNFRINGSDVSQYEFNSGGSGIRHSLQYSNIFDLDADEYVEIFGYDSKGSDHDVGGHASLLRTFFGACKLIGA